MRSLLLASALFVAPIAAHAQIAVQDNLSIVQQIKQYQQDLKAWITQNQQLFHEAATDLNTAKSYLQLVETYAAFVENPTLANALGLLRQAGLGSDLPINPLQVMSLANGFVSMGHGGSLAGDLAKLQMLSGYATSAFSANHAYTCTGTDQACVNLNARANGIAGSMGMAQTAYADIQAHQAVIAGLRADLEGVTDPAKRETIIAQIGTEQLYIQNELASVSAMNMQSGMAQQSDTQRTLELQRASADAYFSNTQPLTGGLIPVPPPPPLFAAN